MYYEIGVLADSLNDLSRKLSSALSELQSANQKLQADIDMERQLLQKVVDNLWGNAAAYSPAGEHITVKAWQVTEKAHLTIENTGVHIPDEDIPKLFEAFYRVDQSRNRQTGGTGLGLYIVKTSLICMGWQSKSKTQRGA